MDSMGIHTSMSYLSIRNIFMYILCIEINKNIKNAHELYFSISMKENLSIDIKRE